MNKEVRHIGNNGKEITYSSEKINLKIRKVISLDSDIEFYYISIDGNEHGIIDSMYNDFYNMLIKENA